MTRTTHSRTRTPRKSRGGSLIEILVTIVIFTIGILGLVQVFPSGLGILRTTRTNTVATALARAQMEQIKANVEQLPEAILPINYARVGGQWVIQADLSRMPGDPTPIGTGIRLDGTIFNADGDFGYWPYFSGANVMRRVIGEARVVPSPRFVDGAGGTLYGGLMNLQFGPVFVQPGFVSNFIVYGNDLNRNWVEDFDRVANAPIRGNRDRFTSFIDEDGLFLSLPQGPYRADAPGFARQYRLTATARYSGGVPNERRSFVGVVVSVPSAGAGVRPVHYPIDLASVLAVTGLTFDRVELDTVRVQRVYENTTNFLTNAQVAGSQSLLDDAAFQYRLMNAQVGTLLFNPLASNYQEQRGFGRVSQVARVDYDVLDWRIIRDDFRVPNAAPYHQSLILNSIKVAGDRDLDGVAFTGIGIDVPAIAGGTERRDVVVVDSETGGIFLPDSYRVDKSKGIITFIDIDGAQANGLTGRIVFPQNAGPTVVDDIRGRSVRVLYQGNGEFAVQLVKATSEYSVAWNASLGFAQCYVGGSDPGLGLDTTTRIYFPKNDIGKKVIIGEVWFQDGSGSPRVLREQEFIIQAPQVADWGAYAYVDIREKAAAALLFDFSRGYAVRRVRGASVGVRVTWNPTEFTLTNDTDQNLTRVGRWLASQRTSSTETFLVRGENQ